MLPSSVQALDLFDIDEAAGGGAYQGHGGGLALARPLYGRKPHTCPLMEEIPTEHVEIVIADRVYRVRRGATAISGTGQGGKGGAVDDQQPHSGVNADWSPVAVLAPGDQRIRIQPWMRPFT